MKLTITDLANTFTTSDHHFGHRNVIKYCLRPFTDVEEMNEKMVLAWNSVVPQDAVVLYFGDFSMGFAAVEAFTKRLNGRKILIAGNHDLVHPAHKKSNNPEKQAKQIQAYLDNGWAEVHVTGEIEIPGVGIVNANHMPYLENPSGQDIRHAKFRPADDGKWLLCGHVHEKWAQRGKMINVGVDVRNFKPISIDEIISIINAAPEGYPKPAWTAPKEDY